jgi:hypothetical protein
MKEEKIVCAAIYFKDGKEHPHQPRNIKTGIVISGLRHCNCFATAGVIKLKQEHEYSQGFITTDHVYVDRYMAFKIAKANGQFLDDPQVPHDISHQQLFSEDLY